MSFECSFPGIALALREGLKIMALRLWGLATAGALVIGTALLHSSARTAQAAPSPPEPCGTLDLSNPLTQHCEILLFHNTYLYCASGCHLLDLLAPIYLKYV